MAQGFKPAKAGASKVAKGKSKSGPRRGPKQIAPKKQAAVEAAKQKRKQTAGITKQLETDMAGRAAGGGPLTIMKSVGEEANAAREKEKQRKRAKQQAKGRA